MSHANTWMPLYVGDYLAGTMRLSTLQHGAYLLLLMEYWRSGPLPDDDDALASIAKMGTRAWRAQGGAVRRFFHRGADGLLHQRRADAEIARADAISGARRQAALARHGRRGGTGEAAAGEAAAGEAADAGANRDANADANAADLLPHARCRATATDHTSSVPSERRGGAARVLFDARNDFWSEGQATFRRLTGRAETDARAFLGRLLRALGDDCAVALALIRQAERDRPGDPAAWLTAAAAARGRERAAHPLSQAAQMRRIAAMFPDAFAAPDAFPTEEISMNIVTQSRRAPPASAQKWLVQLAALVSPMYPAEAATALARYLPLLSGLPEAAFNRDTLDEAARCARAAHGVPSYAEVRAVLGIWACEHRTVAALPRPRDCVRPEDRCTPEQAAAILQRHGFVPPGEKATRRPVRPAWLTSDQLAEARRRAGIVLPPRAGAGAQAGA